jgi:hypothetical protein
VNFGRSPILLIVALFFLLFIVLSIINRKSSTSLNDSDRALRTTQALNRIMDAEATFLKQHGSYTGHIADLIPIQKQIGTDLTDSIVNIQVDSNNNKTYFTQVGSTVLLLNRTFTNGKVVQHSCLQIKSAGKPYCTRTTSDIRKTLTNGATGPTGDRGPTGHNTPTGATGPTGATTP